MCWTIILNEARSTKTYLNSKHIWVPKQKISQEGPPLSTPQNHGSGKLPFYWKEAKIGDTSIFHFFPWLWEEGSQKEIKNHPKQTVLHLVHLQTAQPSNPMASWSCSKAFFSKKNRWADFGNQNFFGGKCLVNVLENSLASFLGRQLVISIVFNCTSAKKW